MKPKSKKVQNPPRRCREAPPTLPPYEQWIQGFGENRAVRDREFGEAMSVWEGEGGANCPEQGDSVETVKFGYSRVTVDELKNAPGDWLFTDGGVIYDNINYPSRSLFGGGWAWIRVKDGEIVAQDSGVLTPHLAKLRTITNNMTELYAMIHGLANLPKDWQGTVVSDSQVTLNRRLPGAKMNEVPEKFAAYARRHFARYLRSCRWVLVDGHPNDDQLESGIGKRGGPVSKWNVLCDKECGRQHKEWREKYDAKPVQAAPAAKVEVL